MAIRKNLFLTHLQSGEFSNVSKAFQIFDTDWIKTLYFSAIATHNKSKFHKTLSWVCLSTWWAVANFDSCWCYFLLMIFDESHKTRCQRFCFLNMQSVLNFALCPSQQLYFRIHFSIITLSHKCSYILWLMCVLLDFFVSFSSSKCLVLKFLYVLQKIKKTRSSWLNCALRDDEAVYWVSIGH